MTSAKKRLRDLRERQSRQRGRMAELALLDNLDDETRAELDRLEQGVPDLERQLRAATVALEDEERESATRAVNEPDSYGRNAHCCAPPAQIRTWSLNHPAPTSGA